MSKTDNELLKLAAKAVGIECDDSGPFKKEVEWQQFFGCAGEFAEVYSEWNPLSDDGDALRLAVDLDMDVCLSPSDKVVTAFTLSCGAVSSYTEAYGNDKHAATRRAIVRAAAAIGEAMQ